MIIEFAAENFRSIKEKQVLSLLVENPKNHLAECVAFPANDKTGVLRSAGIYGANASGKSNVLLALGALSYLILNSNELKEDSNIPCYEPFLLAESTREAPIDFEVSFFNKDNIRCVYSISFDKQSILTESLDFYPTRQKANIFKRSKSDTWETISFGAHYKGGTKRIPFFKNNSYLSKAGNNAAASDLIRSIYKYFLNHLHHVTERHEIVVADFFDDKNMLTKVANLLRHVDTGITNIEAKPNKSPITLPEGFPESLKRILLEKHKRSFFFEHKTESGRTELFRESLESTGTRKLFELLPLLISTLSEGNVLVMDELENSFHPHIAEMIIRLFNDPEVNCNNAQLIFSTHNIHLMSPNNLRRDQIWLTEKIEGQTRLFSVADFDKNKVKGDSPFDRWYDQGRFGALPKINYMEISKLLRPVESVLPSEENSS